MEVHIYSSIKAIVSTDIVKDSNNTKRPKSKENQLAILRIYAFCQKNSALQALTYIEGNDQTGRPIWNYATGTLTSWKGC